MTFTDEHGVTHGFANVHTLPGEGVVFCGWSVRDAWTLDETNDVAVAVTCLNCIANEHRYPGPLRRRMVRLRDER